MANNQIVISRIQNRRGIRENLPQPLLPGEFALTVDTGELWIGTDPNQPPFGVRTYGSGAGDISSAENIADNQIVSAKFTVLDQTGFNQLVDYLTSLPTPAVVLTDEDILWDGRTTVFIAADTSVDLANTINNVVTAVGNSPVGGAQVAQAFDALGALNDPSTDPSTTDAFDPIEGDFLFTVSGSNAEQGANAARLINRIHGSQLVTTLSNLQVTTTGVGVGSSTFRDWQVFDTEASLPFSPTWQATGTVSADSTTDKMHLVSGDNINIDVDVTNDAIRISNTSAADPDTIYTGFTTSPVGNNVATEATLTNGTAAFTDVPNVIFDIDGDSDVIFIEYSLNSGANIAGSDNLTAVGNMRVVASNTADTTASLIDDQTVISDAAYSGLVQFQAVRVAGTPVSTATDLTFSDNSPSADTITYDAGGSDFVTEGFTNGMEIVVSGTASNNGVYTIDTVSASTITLIATDTLANEIVAAPRVPSLTGRNQVKLQYKNTFTSDILLRFVCRRWMSYDYAATPLPPPFIMVLGVFAPADEGNAYGSQYVSSTGIGTWTETPAIAPTNPAFYRPDALAYKAATNTFVAGSSSSTSAIHAYSTDNGANWTIATRVDFMTSFAIAYNPTADRWVSVGNSGKAQYSDDDGATWNIGATQPSGNLRDVIWSPTNSLWFACNTVNEVYKSSDGTNWSLTASEPGGPSSNQLLSLWTVGNRLFAGTADIGATGGTIYYSDDDGDTWNAPSSNPGIGSSANIDEIGYDGSGVLMATSQLNNLGNLLRSTDNGVNWTAEATGIAGTQNFSDIKYDSNAGVWILVGGVQNTASKIWTSPTGLNGSWTERENGTGTDGFGQILEVIGGKTIVVPT